METSISLEFADGEYLFALGLKQINEIQNACNAGIGAVFSRVAKGRYHRKTDAGEVMFGDPTQSEYRIEDLTSVIRQGLIGGGRGTVDGAAVIVDATRANDLIANYVVGEGQAFEKAWTLAYSILAARIVGFEPPDGSGFDKKKRRGDDRLDFPQALANCAMMNIGPEECGRMSLWDYGALLWAWNKAHDPDPQASRKPVDIDRLRRFNRAHLH